MSSGTESKMDAGEHHAAGEIRIEDLVPADVGQEQEDALRGGIDRTAAGSPTDLNKDMATSLTGDAATQSCTDIPIRG
jgi:hypothetical protein